MVRNISNPKKKFHKPVGSSKILKVHRRVPRNQKNKFPISAICSLKIRNFRVRDSRYTVLQRGDPIALRHGYSLLTFSDFSSVFRLLISSSDISRLFLISSYFSSTFPSTIFINLWTSSYLWRCNILLTTSSSK